MPACRTCEADDWALRRQLGVKDEDAMPLPEATYVGHPTPNLDWPLCDHHMQHALIAGWHPEKIEK
jgi:hypothetical protein